MMAMVVLCSRMFPSFVFQAVLQTPSLASRALQVKTMAMNWSHTTRDSSKQAFLLLPAYARRKISTAFSRKSEEEIAAAATSMVDTGDLTVFDKILKREIPANIVYEDDRVLAFHDINPQAPVHIVLIPKIRDGLTHLSKAELRHRDILGHLMYTTGIIAKQEGIQDGYRVVVNNGPTACQSVYHLHLHIIGGRQFMWPPG